MSIVARCNCGNRMGLADVLAGKTIACSKCGLPVEVPLSSTTAASTAAKARQKESDAMPAISVNPALVVGVIVGVAVLAILLALYFGPWRVGNQWAAMSSHANDQVTDVINFSIQAYESENGMFDMSASHMVPAVSGPATFVPPMMAFSMPQRIIFSGKTTQGSYMGTYDTTNGEITANIEIGGATVGGLISVRKATGTFQVTGREKNGNVEAEVDGQPLHIVVPKYRPRGE